MKNFKREARIITELFDEKLPNGVKPESKLSSDWWGIAAQVAEQTSTCPPEQRKCLIEFIAQKYNINLKITDKEFNCNDKIIRFLEYYPTSEAGRQSLYDLTNMSAIYFREKVSEILAVIPGGLQDFRELAEETPYIFDNHQPEQSGLNR